MQTICEHPRIIVNPLAPELIAEHCNYYIRGVKHSVTGNHRSFLYAFDKNDINSHRQNIVKEDIDNCYIVDRLTGDIYPLYLEVPCGKCLVCKDKKINSFVSRCKLETLKYDCKPIFITLTYEENKRKQGGLSVRDAQLFFKRLRINLFRHGYREKIRYVLVGEYGRNTYREHLHAILWNLHATDIFTTRQIAEEIGRSWSNGFVMWRFVEPHNDKGFFYTAKYLRKDMVVPEGCNPPFLLASRRGGGIGSALPKSVARSIKRQSNTEPQIFNKFTGKSENVQLSKYLLDKLFPTFSRSLPVGLKRDVRDYLLSYSILKYYHKYETKEFDYKAKRFADFFRPYFYCPILECSDIQKGMVYSPQRCLRMLAFCEPSIESAINLGRKFYDNARKLHDERNRFLFKLFLNEMEQDINHRAYKAGKSFALAAQREIL